MQCDISEARDASTAPLPSPDEWDPTQIPDSRRASLEAHLSFCGIAEQIAAEAIVDVPKLEDIDDLPAPQGTARAIFPLQVDTETSDVFHNGRSGLRAHYWASAARGDEATKTVRRAANGKLIAATPHDEAVLRTPRGVQWSQDTLTRALELPSTRVWVAERVLRLDGRDLRVARWECNENEEGNPRLWRWTPRATVIQVKTGWLTPDGREWIVECKKGRAMQIYRWGYS